jgi:hypothetical protein
LGNIYKSPEGNVREAFEQTTTEMEKKGNIDKYELLLIDDVNAIYRVKQLQLAIVMNRFMA